MTYEDFLNRYNEEAAKIRADYQALTRKERLTSRAARVKSVISARVFLLVHRAVAIERLGITADEARALAYDGSVVCFPDRHRNLVGIAPRIRG